MDGDAVDEDSCVVGSHATDADGGAAGVFGAVGAEVDAGDVAERVGDGLVPGGVELLSGDDVDGLSEGGLECAGLGGEDDDGLEFGGLFVGVALRRLWRLALCPGEV